MYPTRPGRLHLILALGVLVVLVFAQQQHFVDYPGSQRVASGLHDATHGTWFAIVTWLVAGFVRRFVGRGATVVIAALLGIAIAVGTEVLQKFTGGDPELGDVCFDVVGMCAALFAWGAREELLPKRIGIGIAVVLLVASLWPAVRPLRVEHARDSIAPELVRFDSALLRDMTYSTSVTQVVDAPAGWEITGQVLKVTLADEQWPGMSIVGPISDWRGYLQLDVDLFVDGTAPMPIWISVRLDHAPVPHVYREFECAPGRCHLVLGLTDLFNRDVARVNEVVIYSEKAAAGRTVYFGRVALRK